MDQANQTQPSVSYQPFENADPQYQSLLFKLPGEVRDAIYTAALTSYEDSSKPYDKNTYWFRPHYSARRRSDYTLLQTCKRVYQEAWFKLWSLADHTFWLTASNRAPEGAKDRLQFLSELKTIHAHHGDLEIEQVRLFAQMCVLEPGGILAEHYTLPYFHPKSIVLTIRHTDWWYWESDEWLRIDATWVNYCKLPASTQRFQMELETLVRKKDQVESVVDQMKQTWFFTRTDGVILTARHTATARTTWRGSSTWNGARWVRDETDPDCIDYYIATVTWEHEPDVEKPHLPAPKLRTTIRPPKTGELGASLEVRRLNAARVPPNTRAGEAARMVLDHELSRAANAMTFDVETEGVWED